MTRPTEPQRDQLRREAAEQIARAHAAGVRPEDDAALSRWRSQDPGHDLAFAEASGAWDGLGDLGRHPALMDMLGEPTFRERWVAWRRRATACPRLAPQQLAFASLVLAVIGAACWFGGQALHRPDFETKIAEVRDVPLADGSVVTLGGKSSIDVRFDAKARRVKLAGGEAFFSVTRNPNRPFIVEAGDTRIRVVGTKFNVNLAGGQVRVSVLEGVVQVIHAGNPVAQAIGAQARAVRITANQEAVDPANRTGPVVASERVAVPGAWREGRLGYEDAPLAEVVADINRYRPAAVRITSGAVGDLRVTTSFKVSQIDSMLLALPQSLPVEVHQRSDGTIEIGPS